MVYWNNDLANFDWEAALPLLSEQRRQQVLKYKYELGRKTCAAAYLLLCEGLRKEYGITDLPVFGYGEHGKPFLEGWPDSHFNISHCRETVVCAIARRPVGIDVESIHSFRESLVAYTMNEKEVEQIKRAERPDVEFIRLWTMKEAVLKLTGEGISRDLKTVLTGKEKIETSVNIEKNYISSIIFG